MEPWVLVRLCGQMAAVRAEHVLEIASDPRPRALAGAPAHLRGLMRLRNDTVPLIDLRAYLGFPSAVEELRGLMEIFRAREQDHRDWMNALVESVTTGEPFTRSLDPHECAFGRWYDAYRTDNLVVAAQLKRIEAPHAALHAGGAEVVRLFADGHARAALDTARHLRATTFHQTLALFQEAQRMVEEESREVALVVQAGKKRLALAVDAAEAVEPVHPVAAEERPARHIEGFARRARGEELVMLVDLRHLLSDLGAN